MPDNGFSPSPPLPWLSLLNFKGGAIGTEFTASTEVAFLLLLPLEGGG
jgi:hypothetical protein